MRLRPGWFPCIFACPPCKNARHERLGRSAVSPRGGADRKPGCREPQAEPPRDKDAGNFCELFVFRKGAATAKEADPRADSLAKLEALFKK